MTDQTVDFLTEDFSEETKAKIPQLVEPVKADRARLSGALESLLALEKKTRLAADQKSTVMLATAIVQLCKDCGEWKMLNDHIILLSKRRAQLKKVIQVVVQEAMNFIEETPDKETKIALIETLRTVSAGKMYAELELARMTRILADMKEKDGDIVGAAEIMQELSVETIGSMESREKLEFILEQVRLCLLKKDYIRAEIIAKKVTDKQINKEDLQDLKLKHFKLMVTLHTYKKSYLDACKDYDSMYRTKIIQDDDKEWKVMLSKSIIYLTLSPFDYEVSEMLLRLKSDPKVEQLPGLKSALVAFTTPELIKWPIASEKDFREHEEFQEAKAHEDLWAVLHKRVVQHNIRVLSQCYTRLSSTRLSQLLQLDSAKTEEFLSEMVSSKQLFAKIDRCAGTVSFTKMSSSALVLNNWSSNISSLLALVDKTGHLINKENMMHGIA